MVTFKAKPPFYIRPVIPRQKQQKKADVCEMYRF